MVPSFDFENKYSEKIVCGIDEVGLGPLAGPIVVAGVIFNQNISSEILQYIDDSKKLSKKKREYIFEIISNHEHIKHFLAIVPPEKIDSCGLRCAWDSGVLSVIESISQKIDICLIDGNKKPEQANCFIETIVKGDQKSYSIAAASIIAKVTRDRIMCELHKEFDIYGFDKNAGYGTKFHMTQLDFHGPCRHHRYSYAHVAKSVRSFL